MVLLSSDSTILRVVLLPGEVLGKHGQCWPCVLTFRGGKDYSALVELFQQCITVGERRIINDDDKKGGWLVLSYYVYFRE